ncbi:alpha/beta hydrolase [Streptomyces sp. NPDC058045]|uniref:alpha/beta hydrolase n=1 Tax=Streptomyces sp. NPDC058045 TaxID=3346311 RepID=UPI0036EAE4B3
MAVSVMFSTVVSGRRMRWAGAVLAVLLLVAGCGSGGTSGAGRDSGPPGSGAPSQRASPTGSAPPAGKNPDGLPQTLTGQHPAWGRCGKNADGERPPAPWQCATLKVPLDYAHPGGRTFDVALIRARTTGKGPRIGSLVFNFGGPGGSGVDLLPSFADQYTALRGRYDLVSFDPRGVGASEGIRCLGDAQLREAERLDLTPDNRSERTAYFRYSAEFARGCAKNAGGLLPHLSTEDTARDLDLIRQVLGDRRLHYFGISYGTQLGGVYAHLFPERTGRLLLDAVVDPTQDGVGHARGQARGFQRALDDYLASTDQDPARGTRKIAALLHRLDSHPLPAADGRRLTESLAVTGITATLYSKRSWPLLTRALTAAAHDDGRPLLRLADLYNDRDPSGSYGTESHSQRAISCRDDAQRPTPGQAERRLGEFRRVSPVFGEFLAWDTAGWCHSWPVPGLHRTPEVSAPGAAPLLVVGNTGDPATPYEGARRMADELGDGVGVLLTWKGEGHGAYGGGSRCVDGAVDAYLLRGTVPKDGTICS